MDNIKFLNVRVRVGDNIGVMPGLEYEGKLWLAPVWSDTASLQISKPDVLYRFDNRQHTKHTNPLDGIEYTLNGQLPANFPDGESSQGFEVAQAPDISVSIPSVQSSH